MFHQLPPNLRIWRFVFLFFACAFVFGGLTGLLKAMLALPTHSPSARALDAVFSGLVFGVPFAVLRQFKDGGHSWLRR